MPRFRLASYNIHLGIGRDGEFQPARIAQVVSEIEADVIALQEVSLGAGKFNLLDYLATQTGMQAIAAPTLVSRVGEYGNALLTRLHVVEVHRWDLSVGRHEPRGAIDALLHGNGGNLRVLATHLGLRPGERRKQIRALLEIIRRDNRFPTALLGDVNEWFLWGRPLRWMHRYFERTPALPTFPSGHPLFALDRIWLEPRRALMRMEVHASTVARMASDHLPIVADIELEDAVALTRQLRDRSATVA
ncbi:MAG TPA: endonuclease/exonuclease/phosphatase family protein [Burkholderiales bacterium]|nr:endonuclease/exonuclease/phosphatase family protein [Burkholderiales bacterium]